MTILLLAILVGSGSSEALRIVDIDTTREGRLVRSDVTFQVGNDPLDRFVMHRVSKVGLSKRPLLLLSALYGNFNAYTWSETGAMSDSFAGALALAGYDAWGYSPRPSQMAPSDCPSGACSAARDWGISTYLDDIDVIRAAIGLLHPFKKPVVIGESLGAMLAIAAVDRHPSRYAGAVLYEGMLYSKDASMRAGNATLCAQSEAQLAAGQYLDLQSPGLVKVIDELGFVDPAGASPFPFFPPGTTNGLARLFLFSAPGPVQPAFVPTPTGLILLAGDFANLDFVFASSTRAHLFTQANSDVESNAVLRDIRCGLAGERTFTSNLKAFRGPVLAIEGGQGFGRYMDDTLDLFGSRNVDVVFDPLYAHADHYLSADHASDFEDPILDWLDANF